MVTINGKKYRKFKSIMGRRYLVRMTPSEVTEVYMFRAAVVIMPLVCIFGMAALAGMI